MSDKADAVEKKGGFSWTGFIVGLAVGAALFMVTIEVVRALMYSLTAA